jgi:hypothetical protein
MTLLRRAPREVYRVYGEEEFFADTAAPVEDFDAAHSASADAHRQRLAGATVLLAVVGAVGAAIAITTMSSMTAVRRRGGMRLSAASGRPTSAGERIGRLHASSATPAASGRPEGHGDVASRHLHGRAPQPGSRGPAREVPQHRGWLRVVAQTVSVSVPAHVVQMASTGDPVTVTDPAAGGSTSAHQLVQVEFGFER